MRPKRIQRKRTKGWRMPEGARYVGRPTMWGNSFGAGSGDPREERARAVECYGEWIEPTVRWSVHTEESLRGLDLACWCGLCDEHADGLPLGVKCDKCQPCHADVLLELANREES